MTVEQLNKITDEIESVNFRLFSDQEVLSLSVAEINFPRSFNDAGLINPNGVYDLRLGASKTEKCQTCQNGYFSCSGHFGHIALPLPLYNPFLIRLTFQLFEMTCPSCRHLLVRPIESDLLLMHIELLELDLEHYCGVVRDYSHEFYQMDVDQGKTYDEMKQKLNLKFEESGIIKEIADRKRNLKHYEKHRYVRAVVERKHQLIRDFMKRRTFAFLKNCAHCGLKRSTYSLLNSATIQMHLKENSTLSDEYGELSRKDPLLGTKILEKIDKNKKVINSLVVRSTLRELWQNEKMVLEKILPFVAKSHFDNESIESAINPLEALITSVSLGQPSPMDVFFCNYILVSPTKFRPLRYMSGRQFEDSKSTRLNSLISSVNSLKKVYLSLMESDKQKVEVETKSRSASKRASTAKTVTEMASRDSATDLFYRLWNEAQINYNLILDSDSGPKKSGKVTTMTPGLKQLIEKKEGLFRKNMMGKRVNYAARSVISPDPYIMVDEIGFPEIFAKRLSFPEPVNDHNYEELKKMVENGPDIYPGALSVVTENGNVVRLNPKDASQRSSIAQSVTVNLSGKINPDMRVKVVNRHLRSGDVLLINRQPTLHKPSIMAHRARVLPGEKTIRLHYANCKCYNADFDGDEMNAHFPQSFLTRSEGYNIVSVNYQYLVPKDGTPLSGLIQDHIVAATMLTYRGQFFNQSDYQNLVFAAISFVNRRIKFLPPAIMKPQKMWSGKQIVSTILLNLVPEEKQPPTLTIASKLKPSTFLTQQPRSFTVGGQVRGNDLCESEVLIQRGELLIGVFDKSNLGNTSYGVIHTCYELYGGEVSSAVLTAFARLANCYLQTICGFTLGVYDILVTKQADAFRKEMIHQSTQVGDEAVALAFNVSDSSNKDELFEEFREAHTSSNPLFIKMLDGSVKAKTDEIANSISKACLPVGLLKPFPFNHLQMMIQPGAKGGQVNAMQISCLLGQIELEGKRVPRMISGKTLPSFPPYETSPKAGGFVTGRFLTGIRPQEFFFHCMAGREGLIDTAVKTSRSGYLQRCLIKHLEGLIVNYDSTVRDSDQTVIQYLYGEDGLDILKSQMLKPKAISLMVQNLSSLQMSKSDLNRVKKCTDKETIQEQKESIEYWENVNGPDRLARKRGTAFPKFFEKMWSERADEQKSSKESRDLMLKDIFNSWFRMNRDDRRNLNSFCSSCPDPLTFQVNPSRNFGVLSEKMEQLMQNYIDQNPSDVLIRKGTKNLTPWRHDRVKESDFRKAFCTRYQKALCEPGEAVGLLAAQSIGEPSTQMTLNTFHFAGRGEMNVTLGIPRLREILMTASPNISTPSMDIPVRRDLPTGDVHNLADQVRIQLTSVTLADVLEHVDIEDTYEVTPARCAHLYRIRFKFLRRHYFKHKYSVTASQILEYFANKFIPALGKSLRRKIAIQNRTNTLFEGNLSKAIRADEGPDDDDETETMEARSALLNRIGEEESDDSDDDNGDGDADDLKNRGVRNQELTYEEPEDEEKEQSDSENEAEDADTTLNTSKVINVANDELDDDRTERAATQSTLNSSQAQAPNYLDGHIMNYRVDEQKQQWCELILSFGLGEAKIDLATMIQEEAKKAVMYKVGKIEKAFLVKNPNAADDEYDQMIKTEGVSFLSLIKFSNIIDLNRVYSNDIHAIANTYGIEAGRRAIVNEMVNVFGMYGIEIDPRHLNLIGDYMTSSGVIRGMNRQSMQTNASPVQQITFETSMNFIKAATMLGVSDQISSPSARIFVGRPVTAGSGASQCVMPSPVEMQMTQDSIDTAAEDDPKKRKYLNIVPPNKRTKFEE